eukprot:PhF_6_TR13426/c0_g1_i1/m.21412
MLPLATTIKALNTTNWNHLCTSIQQEFATQSPSSSTQVNIFLPLETPINATSLCRINVPVFAQYAVTLNISLRCDPSSSEEPNLICNGNDVGEGGCFEFVSEPAGTTTSSQGLSNGVVAYYHLNTIGCNIEIIPRSTGFVRTSLSGLLKSSDDIITLTVLLDGCRVTSPQPSTFSPYFIQFYFDAPLPSSSTTHIHQVVHIMNCDFNNITFGESSIVGVVAPGGIGAQFYTNVTIQIVNATIHNISWKNGGILVINPGQSGARSQRFSKCFFSIENTSIWDVMRITTASVSTSGLISVFGLVGPIESENKDTGFAAIEGVFSNVSYNNSNERLMYIRGEGCKVFISQVSLSNIYTWTQNGAVIRFCGGSEVIIYSLESINTGGRWDGGVIGLWNSVATIYNLTARNTVCNCGGILALCQFSSATVYNMVGYNTTSRICGGIAYLERSQAKVINITAFDSFSGNDGGMVSVVANSNIEIQSLTSYRSRSGGNGAILCVNSSSTCSIGVLMVQESSSSGSGGVIFVEDSTLTSTSSVILSNVTALGSRGGGAFFITGPKSNLFVRGTINIQNV